MTNDELFEKFLMKIERCSDGRLELREAGTIGSVSGASSDELLQNLLGELAKELRDVDDRSRMINALFEHEAVTKHAEFMHEVSIEQVGRLFSEIARGLGSLPDLVERLAGFIEAGGFKAEPPPAPPTVVEVFQQLQELRRLAPAEASNIEETIRDKAMIATQRELRRRDPAAWAEWERDVLDSARRLDDDAEATAQ